MSRRAGKREPQFGSAESAAPEEDIPAEEPAEAPSADVPLEEKAEVTSSEEPSAEQEPEKPVL